LTFPVRWHDSNYLVSLTQHNRSLELINK